MSADTTTRSLRALLALAIAATPLAACGGADDDTTAGTSEESTTTPSDAEGRTVEIAMTDNAFEPDELTVEDGEAITFEFVNEGRVVHEAYLGSEEEQDGHAGDMAGMAGMAGSPEEAEHSDHMDDQHMSDERLVTVEPGDRATLTTTFDEPGTVVIGCHQPGHWESGMKATVTVS
jgi:uncharacterized cupredoxin-like copper-binding protein